MYTLNGKDGATAFLYVHDSMNLFNEQWNKKPALLFVGIILFLPPFRHKNCADSFIQAITQANPKHNTFVHSFLLFCAPFVNRSEIYSSYNLVLPLCAEPGTSISFFVRRKRAYPDLTSFWVGFSKDTSSNNFRPMCPMVGWYRIVGSDDFDCVGLSGVVVTRSNAASEIEAAATMVSEYAAWCGCRNDSGVC